MRALPPGPDGVCLCGSGRLFGNCCATRVDAEIAAWQRMHEAERRLVRQTLEYGLSTFGQDLFANGLRHFAFTKGSPESLMMALPAFDRWFAFSWIPNLELEEEDLKVPDTWPTATLGVAWLASQSTAVDDFDRAFVITAAESPYSLLRVEAIRSGWAVLLPETPIRAAHEVARRHRAAALPAGGASASAGAA